MATSTRVLNVDAYEPCPRFFHCAAPISGKAYIWGGQADWKCRGDDPKYLKTSVVDVFDPYLEQWAKREATGELPYGLGRAACTASTEDKLYMYGGSNALGQYSNVLSELNIDTLKWFQISKTSVDGPMVKYACGGLVHFHSNYLGLFGGYGIPQHGVQPGSTFVRDVLFESGQGWSNEFQIINIKEGMHNCRIDQSHVFIISFYHI